MKKKDLRAKVGEGVEMRIPTSINISVHFIITILEGRAHKGKMNKFSAEVHGFEEKVFSEEQWGQGLIKRGFQHLPAPSV